MGCSMRESQMPPGKLALADDARYSSTIVQTIVFIKLWNAEMNGARPARLFLTVDDMRSYEAQLDTRDEYLNLAPTAATADVGASRPDASKAAKGATACL